MAQERWPEHATTYPVWCSRWVSSQAFYSVLPVML